MAKTRPTMETALETLTQQRLTMLGRELGVAVSDKAKKAEQIAVLARPGITSLAEVLRGLARSELKAICRKHGGCYSAQLDPDLGGAFACGDPDDDEPCPAALTCVNERCEVAVPEDEESYSMGERPKQPSGVGSAVRSLPWQRARRRRRKPTSTRWTSGILTWANSWVRAVRGGCSRRSSAP